MKLKYYHTLFGFLVFSFSFAQQIEVQGNVAGQDSGPLPGASVVVKGTTNGTQTDFDGNFTISADANAILIISYVGYSTLEVPASTASVNVILQVDANQLNEVVVVAQGITKSRKALGYAISKVSTEETQDRPEADLSRTLQGKISGVQITPPNGSSGAATNITVRGNVSATQSNAALIVLNNVPFDGNILDIDPNDIKNITVLKGLNAAVLFGSEGRNGVILIETKSGNAELGKKSFSANISATTYFNNIANLPEFQNSFGVGNNFITDAATVGNNGSFGAAFDDVDVVPHPLANNPSFPEFANATVPFVPARNNVNDFFKTGIGQIISLNVTSSGEKASINFSTGYTGEEGIIGNNDFRRFNISVGGRAKLSDRLDLRASLGYNTRTRNSQTGNDVFEFIYRLPRSLDVQNLPFQDPVTGANVFYRGSENPLWTLANTGRERTVNRFTASVNLDYTINEHHFLRLRSGLQTESTGAFDFRNRGGLANGTRFGIDEAIRNTGTLQLESDTEFIVDNTLIFGSNYDISEKIGFNSQIGINSRFTRDTDQEFQFTDQIVFGFLRPNNFRNNSSAEFLSGRENLVGLFGQFDFDYDDYLFLGLSGRYDISSTLEQENQTLFYPGVSLSFLPTSAFNFGGNTLNYLKIRAAYATSAGFPGRFNTRNTVISDPRGFEEGGGGLVITNSTQNALANPNLTPELHQEFELGIESNFFNNLLSLEASVFSRISRDQIFDRDLDRATGFTETTINAGRLDTEGIEIDLGLNLFRNSAFNWNIRNTFTAFETIVRELPDGAERIIIDDNIDNIVDPAAIVGQPLGTFLGSYVVRDTNGTPLINPNNGVLLVSDEVGLEDEIIGNVTPDWRATTIHNLSYKNFNLSAQLEYAQGGSVVSSVVEELFERGVSASTENRLGTFVIPGVLGDPATGLPILDANGNTIPNTIQNNSNRVAFSNFFESQEGFTFDASVFRIREIALSYTLDKSVFNKLPFERVAFTLSGRNVFFYAPNIPQSTNIDPESTNGIRGNTFPTTKRYSFGVSIDF